MKKMFFVPILIVCLILSPLAIKPVSAAAYGTSFTTSITYQNVGSANANITILKSRDYQ